MLMTNETNRTSRQPRRWLRWMGYSFGGFVLLLIVGYFVATSAWCLKTVILPRVSAAANATVTLEGADISPFSAVTLRGLKVMTRGNEPLVSAREVRLRYSLMDIIQGNINVAEVTIESPTVTLVTASDGTSNLDPITQAPKKETAPKPAKPAAEKGKPPQLNLKKFALNNATLRKIDQRKDGTRQIVELSGVTLTADDLANNKTGKLTLTAGLKMDQGLATNSGALSAQLASSFDLTLDAALQPTAVKGATKFAITQALGAFEQASQFGVALDTDITPTELKNVSVRFGRGAVSFGSLTVRGPFDPAKGEGKLSVVLAEIDSKLLNLAGAAAGLEFNQTLINSTNTIELARKGRAISVNGALIVGELSVTQKGQTTPAVSLRTDYALSYDQNNQTALVQTFALTGVRQGMEFLRGTLAKPMLLDLGKGANAADESAFDLVITNFNLADWKAFAGTNAELTSGKLGVSLNLLSQQAGRKLTLKLATRLDGLTAASGSNRIDNADIALDAAGTVQDFTAVALDSYRVALARGGRNAVTLTGSLQFNARSQDADAQAVLEVALPQVASLVVVPGLRVQDGTVTFAGRILQKNTTPQQTNNPVLDRSVTGNLRLNNFTGAFQSNRFDRFVTALDLDIAMRGDAVDIRKCSGALRQSDQPGGGFEVAGGYNVAKKSGTITARLIDLNQHTLKSFLAAALGDKQLESIAINATTTAKLDSATDMAVKADVHVANLVVNDPSGAVPRTPLAVDVNADVAMARKVLDLRAVQIGLTKTERAPNAVTISGRIDTTQSNAITGSVKIASDGLDLTTYYNLFAGKKEKKPATAGGSKPAATTEATLQTEPPAMKLPVSQFTAELNIAKIFLREIAISNLVSKISIENGRVNVNPFTLTLNGGPISLTALANVAVAGYQYDVATKLERVPVEPFVNSFAPDQRGQVKGDLLADVRIKGAGITGPGIQKNLQGNVAFTLTNATVQVAQYKVARTILSAVAIALRIPQLSESPLHWVDARVAIATGTATLQGVNVESSVLRGGVTGTVTINEIMTHSTLNHLPVEIALRRTVADAARITPSGTPADVQFITLPRFVSVGGTVGEPKADIDKIASARILAGTVGAFIGGDAGKILKGLGGFGTAAPSTITTNTSGTANVPATNATPAEQLLKGLERFLKQPPKKK